MKTTNCCAFVDVMLLYSLICSDFFKTVMIVFLQSALELCHFYTSTLFSSFDLGCSVARPHGVGALCHSQRLVRDVSLRGQVTRRVSGQPQILLLYD